MIRDLMLRLAFIPLLGFTLPYLSGIITYHLYSFSELLVVHTYFLATSFCIWTGCNWVHRGLRPLYAPLRQPIIKILTVCLVSIIYTICIGSLSAYLWFRFSQEPFSWSVLLRFLSASCAAVVIFTLVYEIIFLNKEREIDNIVVDQLDKERLQAELQALTNEMDPHFLFNSLTTLNYLIVHQPEQAYLFNNRLAQVYKYFLINKNKSLIPLKSELEFIEDYFYLLQIRHDGKLRMDIQTSQSPNTALIPPFAIQTLIENAIKHNEFSEQSPLLITINTGDQHVTITNNVLKKSVQPHSTGIGLANLKARYRLLLMQDISIEKNSTQFTVKLPFAI